MTHEQAMEKAVEITILEFALIKCICPTFQIPDDKTIINKISFLTDKLEFTEVKK